MKTEDHYFKVIDEYIHALKGRGITIPKGNTFRFTGTIDDVVVGAGVGGLYLKGISSTQEFSIHSDEGVSYLSLHHEIVTGVSNYLMQTLSEPFILWLLEELLRDKGIGKCTDF